MRSLPPDEIYKEKLIDEELQKRREHASREREKEHTRESIQRDIQLEDYKIKNEDDIHCAAFLLEMLFDLFDPVNLLAFLDLNVFQSYFLLNSLF